MGKRFFAMLTAAVCALALTVPAFAGTAAPENEYYAKHRAECRTEQRNFYVNSRDGWADLQTSPVSEKTEARAKNGAEVAVDCTCEKNGTTWGLVTYQVGANPKNWVKWTRESGAGWVKMSDLLLIYDAQSFEEEHGREFTAYDGSFDRICAAAGRRVILWTYPGSGAVAASFASLDDGALKPAAVWMDAAGRVWGKIEGYKGADGWACLSDPGNENLPVTEHSYTFYPAASGTDAGRAQEKTARAAETGDSGTAFAVAGVCGITAFLLGSLRKKKERV